MNENSEIPWITPERIEAQYQAVAACSDATPQLTATRMARWAESVVRAEAHANIQRKQARIIELETTLYTVLECVPNAHA